MSPQSVPPGEMGTHDHDDELEGFFEDLRAAFPARPVASEDEHVAAIITTAHLLADKGDPVVRPASNAVAPAPQVSWLPKQRRNRMWDKKLSERNWTHGVALKVLAPATVFFTMLGGVAWAGGLPQPLQKTASHVASFAGLTIDDGTEDGTEVDTQDPAETDVQEPTSTDTQDGDAQGEDTSGDTSTDNNQDGDSQGEDPSGDATDNQDGDSQGEDTSGDTSSTNSQDGDSQGDTSGDSTSGDNTQDSSGDGSSQDSSGDGSGDSSGSSGGDGQD